MNPDELSLDAELSESGLDALQYELYERLIREAQLYPGAAGVQESMATVARQLMAEVETANAMSSFLESNPADQAQASARGVLDRDSARQGQRFEGRLRRTLSVVSEASTWTEEDQQARRCFQWPDREVVLEFLAGGLVVVAFLGAIGTTVWAFVRELMASQQRHPVSLKVADAPLDRELLWANQTFLSLLMQASADRPVDFRAFGVSQEVYAAIRQALCDERDVISNDTWWALLADNATTIYPPTEMPLTLGDHFLSLDFIVDLLEPLYDPQPLDLDLDSVITELANRIDFDHPLPVVALYRSITELIPDDSGANRLQQIVLARAAIARALARRPQLTGS